MITRKWGGITGDIQIKPWLESHVYLRWRSPTFDCYMIECNKRGPGGDIFCHCRCVCQMCFFSIHYEPTEMKPPQCTHWFFLIKDAALLMRRWLTVTWQMKRFLSAVCCLTKMQTLTRDLTADYLAGFLSEVQQEFVSRTTQQQQGGGTGRRSFTGCKCTGCVQIGQ